MISNYVRQSPPNKKFNKSFKKALTDYYRKQDVKEYLKKQSFNFKAKKDRMKSHIR